MVDNLIEPGCAPGPWQQNPIVEALREDVARAENRIAMKASRPNDEKGRPALLPGQLSVEINIASASFYAKEMIASSSQGIKFLRRY